MLRCAGVPDDPEKPPSGDPERQTAGRGGTAEDKRQVRVRIALRAVLDASCPSASPSRTVSVPEVGIRTSAGIATTVTVPFLRGALAVLEGNIFGAKHAMRFESVLHGLSPPGDMPPETRRHHLSQYDVLGEPRVGIQNRPDASADAPKRGTPDSNHAGGLRIWGRWQRRASKKERQGGQPWRNSGTMPRRERHEGWRARGKMVYTAQWPGTGTNGRLTINTASQSQSDFWQRPPAAAAASSAAEEQKSAGAASQRTALFDGGR